MRQNKNGKGNETDSFNSRTHAGCDSGQITSSPCFAVSIHAPTRGATHSSVALIPFLVSFNSRTHAGCDLDNPINIPYIYSQVSIHAPTRGATDVRSISLQGGIYRFNSRTHAGCDKRGAIVLPPRKSFNSRTHAGCDNYKRKKYGERDVSIHAPTRGATPCK